MSPEERYKVNFLASLVFEGSIQTLESWLNDAPPWGEKFVAELVRDRFVAITTRPPMLDQAILTLAPADAERLLTSPDARTNNDVWLIPTDEACREFDERNPRAMFSYCAASKSHLS